MQENQKPLCSLVHIWIGLRGGFWVLRYGPWRLGSVESKAMIEEFIKQALEK